MNILTFDIEEWFHLLDNPSTKTEKEWVNYESRIHQNMDLIFQLLEETGQSATFFCLGWVARKYPEVIKRIDAAGFEIATHSDLHQLAFEQDRTTFRHDLERSIKSLEDVIGKKIRAYRAPGFSLMQQNKWVFDILIENGIEIDSSIFPAKRAHGGFAEFGTAEPCIVSVDGHHIKEFPINLAKLAGSNVIFSGGGYFRFFPLWFLKRLFRNSSYNMTYFHPRDFDAGQPIIEGLSKVRQFKSYYGLDKCERKLKDILVSMPFMDLRTAESQVDWNKVAVKEL